MPDNEELVFDEAVVEIDVEAEEPETPVEVPEPEPTPAGISREDAYRFLADNPDEIERLKHLWGGQPSQPSQPSPAGAGDPEPNEDDYDSWGAYSRALTQWQTRQFDAKLAQIQQTVAPMAAAPKVKNIAAQLATRNGLDETGKAYIEQALSQVPPHQLDSLTAQDAEFLVNAAYGVQARSAAKPTGRVEPVAGVGPVRVQLNTDRVTPSEWEAYLDIRKSLGKPTSGKEFIAEMRKEGYIK